MKKPAIVLLLQVAFMAAWVPARAADEPINNAAVLCVAHQLSIWGNAPPDFGRHPYDYHPGYGGCAALVARWLDAYEAEVAARERVKQAEDVATINKGLAAAGLPLIAPP